MPKLGHKYFATNKRSRLYPPTFFRYIDAYRSVAVSIGGPGASVIKLFTTVIYEFLL
jgi:hypothetical protein